MKTSSPKNKIDRVLFCGYDHNGALSGTRDFIDRELTDKNRVDLKEKNYTVYDGMLIVGHPEYGATMKQFRKALEQHKDDMAKDACYFFSAHGSASVKILPKLSKIPMLQIPIVFLSSKPILGRKFSKLTKGLSSADILDKLPINTQLEIGSGKPVSFLPSYTASMDEVMQIIPETLGKDHMAYITASSCNSGAMNPVKGFNGAIATFNSTEKPGLKGISVNPLRTFVEGDLKPESFVDVFAHIAAENHDRSRYAVFKDNKLQTDFIVDTVSKQLGKQALTTANVEQQVSKRVSDLSIFVAEQKGKGYLPKTASSVRIFPDTTTEESTIKNMVNSKSRRLMNRFYSFHTQSTIVRDGKHTSAQEYRHYRDALVNRDVPIGSAREFAKAILNNKDLKDQIVEKVYQTKYENRYKSQNILFENAPKYANNKKDRKYLEKVRDEFKKKHQEVKKENKLAPKKEINSELIGKAKKIGQEAVASQKKHKQQTSAERENILRKRSQTAPSLRR